MSMKALRSAAHAAGYAMAAEELPEPQAVTLPVARKSTALALRTQRCVSLELLRAQRRLRRLWLRDWFAGHWPGRAAA